MRKNPFSKGFSSRKEGAGWKQREKGGRVSDVIGDADAETGGVVGDDIFVELVRIDDFFDNVEGVGEFLIGSSTYPDTDIVSDALTVSFAGDGGYPVSEQEVEAEFHFIEAVFSAVDEEIERRISRHERDAFFSHSRFSAAAFIHNSLYLGSGYLHEVVEVSLRIHLQISR